MKLKGMKLKRNEIELKQKQNIIAEERK